MLTGRFTVNNVLLVPAFAKLLDDTVGAEQPDPTANMTLRTLYVTSRARPVTVIIVDAPLEPESTVSGEKDVAPPTYSKPPPALTYVVFAAARKFTHIEYKFGERPTERGRFTLISVLLDPTLVKELADTVGEAQLDPTANITYRTLFVESSPNPLTVTIVEAPADPDNTVSGENPDTAPTNNTPLPALMYVVFEAARRFTQTE